MSNNYQNSTLTGGSQDVNPQWLTTSVTQSAADTTTTAQISLPIDRLHLGLGMVGVIEVLRVKFDFTNSLLVTGQQWKLLCALTTKNFSTAATSSAEPTVIAYATFYGAYVTTVGFANMGPYDFDCTDGADRKSVV